MLNKETLTKINDRSRRSGVPVAAAGVAAGVVLAALTAGLASPVLVGAVLVAGAGAAVAVYLKSGSPEVTQLHYDLDEEAAGRFAAVRRAGKELAAVEKVWWCEPTPGEKSGATEYRAAEVGILETPGISANVEVWGISARDVRLYFFPDCALYYGGGDGAREYRQVPYPAFEVAFGEVERLEEGEVPADAEVVNQTWRHLRDDGGPDLRFTSNPKLTTVSYGSLRLSGPRLELGLLVSSRSAAARFARSFGPAPEEPREEERVRDFVPPTVPEAASAAHAVLGLEAGASKSEVTAAYRKLAREHHPDTVAGLDPGAREASETRMKEINAAYAELRRGT